MTDFIFISASDIHISDTPPRSRIDNFKETILGKISQIAMACKKLNADAALISGDLFNNKKPSKNSHALTQCLIKAFHEFPCPVYLIEGNHDLSENRVDSLSEQPLGVLFADKTLIQLRETVIEKNGEKLSLVGIPYTEISDLSELKIPPKGNCRYQICLLHLYAAPSPGMLFSERIYGYKELSSLGPNMFVLGHYHIDQGIQEVNGNHFINIGSVSRGALSDEDISHHPQIAYIKISMDPKNINIDTRPIKLKVKSPDEIFDIKKREEEKEERKEIEVFVDKLISDSIEKSDSSDKNFSEILDGMKTAKDIKDKVLYFLQEASTKK